ncbi:fatty acid desaturase-domain-containing protein [Xylariaceae sp. FL0255]|nr:fatty acid desaturase-domain-containing protein [Xylariaceae sp. FL0255]
MTRIRSPLRWHELLPKPTHAIQEIISQLQIRNITFCILLPLAGLYWCLYVPIILPTAMLAMALYILSGVGITAGYHRLWSHRSYKACAPLRYFLAICGASSVQGSIIDWCRDHRAHHRWVDTPQDPYNVHRSLLWAHMGWLIFQREKSTPRIDVSDLQADEAAAWQHRYFAVLCLVFGYAVLAAVAWSGWGDLQGGILYAGVMKPYADSHSSRNHIFTALLTFGEGYHNFHHEFPSDYRNGVRWFDYDPTKWCIAMWARLGLVSNLQTFDGNEIRKALFQQEDKKLQRFRKRIAWGTPLEDLPTYSWDEFQSLSAGAKNRLVCIAGVVYDISSFADQHPGGQRLLLAYVGRDATASFNGGVYAHSKAARNLLENMRYGVIRGGGEVEAFKN